MNRPFFSVVIPTRNRSHLVKMAIQSVLRQTFADFELIISDNDDTDATRAVVHSFDDPRIRYSRAHDLSMPDNWENGCDQARGEYLCLLEDKQAFKYSALARIHAAIEAHHQPLSVRWQNDALATCGIAKRVKRARGAGKVHFLTADEILTAFRTGAYGDYKRLLPIPHYGCIHRALVERIRSGPLGRLCHPINPDYSLAFAQLAYCDEVLVIEQGLVVLADAAVSNGQSLRLKGALAQRFVDELGVSLYDMVPVKALTVSGVIYNDYEHIRARAGGHLKAHPLEVVTYFAEVEKCIELSRQLGVDMSPEERAWREALAEQSPEVREAVAQALGSTPPWFRARRAWRRVARRMGSQKAERLVKSIFNAKLRRKPDWQFHDVIDYLDWEHRRRI